MYKHSYNSLNKKCNIESNKNNDMSSSSILYPKDECNKKVDDDFYRKNNMVRFTEKYDKEGNLLSVTTHITPYPQRENNITVSFNKLITNIYDYFQ
jgi:hypothetical protein